VIAAGDRDRRVPAAEMVRLASHYKKRPIDSVAFDLVQYVQKHSKDFVAIVSDEVDDSVALVYSEAPAISTSAFISQARQLLPTRLYEAVAHAVLSEADETNDSSAKPVAKRRVARSRVLKKSSSRARERA